MKHSICSNGIFGRFGINILLICLVILLSGCSKITVKEEKEVFGRVNYIEYFPETKTQVHTFMPVGKIMVPNIIYISNSAHIYIDFTVLDGEDIHCKVSNGDFTDDIYSFYLEEMANNDGMALFKEKIYEDGSVRYSPLSYEEIKAMN